MHMLIHCTLCLIHRLHHKQYADLYGQDGQDVDQKIQEVAKDLNTKDCTIVHRKTTDGQLVVAILTPIMKRILCHVRQASEMLFVDSTGNCDRHGVRVFLLLTHCSGGGVPVGCLLTTSESTSTLVDALRLYLSILPNGAFGSRGYPTAVMTDDCDALRSSLQMVFPQSTLLLCTFHVLQAVWRWLWDSKHAVNKEVRPHYFFLVKAMLFAQSEADIEMRFQSFLDECASHPRFIKYITHLYSRKTEWALCFRNNLLLRGNNTNNYCEAAMKIFKDKILHRTKAYNIIQLIDFICNYLEEFYCRLLIDIANGRCTRRSKGLVKETSIGEENIQFDAGDHYIVQSETHADVQYDVDMGLGVCSCTKGWNGGGCKHQAAIVFHHGVASINFLPVSQHEQNHYHFLATGKTLHNDWFAPLKSSTVTSSSQPQDVSSASETVVDMNISMDVVAPATEPVSMDYCEEESLDDLFRKVDNIATCIKDCLRTDRKYFEPSVQKYVASFHKLNSHSQIISALSSFGKYSGVSTEGKVIASSKRIGIQPTAIARRKHRLRGKKVVRAGRPTKKFLSTLQKQASSSPQILRAVLPKKKAPHNLSVCVMNNQSLGKTHSAK